MTKQVKRSFGSMLHRLVLCRLGRHKFVQPMGPQGRESRRFCLHCGHEQWLAYHQFGQTRYSWQDHI